MIITCTSCSLVLGEGDVQCNIICIGCLLEREYFFSQFSEEKENENYSMLDLLALQSRATRYYETVEKIRNLFARCLDKKENE